jgi:hypothetical protein
MRFPSITIIERIGASQCGIGMLPARIAEVVLRVERAVFRAGSHNPSFGTTVFLPSVVDRHGVVDVLAPDTSYEEKQGSERSAARLKKMVRKYLGAKERSQPISASSCFPDTYDTFLRTSLFEYVSKAAVQRLRAHDQPPTPPNEGMGASYRYDNSKQPPSD